MINDAMLGLNLFMHRCQQPFFTKTWAIWCFIMFDE